MLIAPLKKEKRFMLECIFLNGLKEEIHAELQERSKKGLCLKCGEKWGKEHVCKFKHFQLVLCEGSEGEEEEVGLGSEDGGELEDKVLRVSLRSTQGLTSGKSFKLWGKIHDKLVLLLVDSGASHNFISKELVRELKLEVKDTPEYTVVLGTREKVSNKGVCRKVKMMLQGVEFHQNFFMMYLGGTEVVLGMDWLVGWLGRY